MKERDHKENIIADLQAMGYKVEGDVLFFKRIGMFVIGVVFTNQSRVMINTSGEYANPSIKLMETVESYSKTNAKKLIKICEKYTRKCEAFKKTK